METSNEISVQPAPVVTSFTESSQESKVEKIPNGTVESSVNKEKSVTQSVQSSAQGDQTLQKSVVEEVKQESFSSSSVVVEATKPIQEIVQEIAQEIAKEVEQVEKKESASEATEEKQIVETQAVEPQTIEPQQPVIATGHEEPTKNVDLVQVEPQNVSVEEPTAQNVPEAVAAVVNSLPETVIEEVVQSQPPAEVEPPKPEPAVEAEVIAEEPKEPVESPRTEVVQSPEDQCEQPTLDSEPSTQLTVEDIPQATSEQVAAVKIDPAGEQSAPEVVEVLETSRPEIVEPATIPAEVSAPITASVEKATPEPDVPQIQAPAPQDPTPVVVALRVDQITPVFPPKLTEVEALVEIALAQITLAQNALQRAVTPINVPRELTTPQYAPSAQSETFAKEKPQTLDEVDQGSVTTGDGLEIPLNESTIPPLGPPVMPPWATTDVNNNFVINERPNQPEITTRSETYNKEIQRESIKQQLNEIITDIEKNVQICNEDSNDAKLDMKKPVDLQKIFTPATDVDEIQPGANRKLFASSSFYSPTIHPTVEDQVELARRISHSLSDISNHTSKGQSMYSNRKKRSVKWIHDDGTEEERFIEDHHETKENGFESSNFQQPQETSQQQAFEIDAKKVPLRLVMDPRHVQDMNTTRHQYGYEPSPMSPEFGYELVNALNAQTGKGAELFAKRRKKAEKWVVDQTPTATQIATPTSGPAITAFSDAGMQHVQRSIQQDQIQEKYQQPRAKMVQSPWDAALQTGSSNNAFANIDQQQVYSASTGNVQQYDYGSSTTSSLYSSSKKDVQYQTSSNFTGRDLAYRPNVPQGWNRPPVVLPAEFSNVVDEAAAEFEVTEIYTSQQNYLELIRRDSPSPPVVEYQGRCGQVETNIYDEPVQELIIEPDDKEPTPEYQTVPVKDLINTYEKGIYTPPEIPVMSSTSSITSEKISKFSSTTTSNFNEVSLPQQSAPLSFSQAPAPAAVAQAPIQKPVQQAQPKPYQSGPQSFLPKPQPQVVIQPPKAATKMQIPSPRNDAMSPRSGVNASSVSPSILKKQIQLDAAVPVAPGDVVPGQSPVPYSRGSGRSPVPIFNTAPAPFGFPALSIQTPETIAQVAPAATPMVPYLQDPKPLPLIISTPLPNYTSSYNNAARPFNEFKDFYRPINMDSVSHKLVPPVVYTDF